MDRTDIRDDRDYWRARAERAEAQIRADHRAVPPVQYPCRCTYCSGTEDDRDG